MTKEQSSRIRVIGFLMTLAIVMYHVGNGGVPRCNDFDELTYTALSGLFNYTLAPLAMDWFYTTTAFLLFYHLSPANFIPKLKRRFVTLLLPYLIWQVLFIPVAPPASWKSFIKTVFFLQQWPPNNPLWYIYAIFLLAFLSPLLWLLLRGRKTGFISAVGLALGSYFLFQAKGEALPGNIPNMLKYTPAYLFGAYFGLHADDSEHEQLKYMLLILVGALLINPFRDNFFFTFALHLLPMLLIYLAPVSERFAASPVCGLSFLMYALQPLILGIVSNIVRGWVMKVTPYAWVTSLAGRLAMIPAIILLAWIVWRILSAVSPKLLSILTGNRVKPYTAKS